MAAATNHEPVMLKEVMQYLQPQAGKVYVDATFGAGGYSKAILQSCDCRLYAIDQDPNVIEFSTKITQQFNDRFKLLHGNFANIKKLLADENISKIDGIVFDLGVSSMQLDNAERGFSFRKNAQLDMRMSQEGTSAKDIVNNYPEEELANIIYNFGEERKSRSIAKSIVEKRKESPIETTEELANIVRAIVKKSGKADPATKTFQALRIEVNKELDVVYQALQQCLEVVEKDGHIVVVTFHSLEDRIVKQFFKNNSKKNVSTNKYKISAETGDFKLELITKKAVKPTREEEVINKRSRSAKLRAAKLKITTNN